MTNNFSRFAVNTYSYTLTMPVRQCLESLAQRGYREFELMMYPGHLWPEHADKAARRELKDFIDDNGIVLSTINMPNIDINIAAANSDMRELSLGVIERSIKLASDLGAPAVIIGPGKANPLMPMPHAQLVEYFHTGLKRLVPFAANHDCTIYVENMPFAFLPGIGELLTAIDAFGDNSVGVVWDAANSHYIKEDLGTSLRACAERLKLVHLSDTNQVIYKHDEVGLGDVNFSRLPAVLAEVGYENRAVLEVIALHDADGAIDRSSMRLVSQGW